MPRPRKQTGHVYRQGDFWYVRYRKDVYEGDQVTRKQLAHQLAPVAPEHRRLRTEVPPEIEDMAEKFLRPLNDGASRADETRTLSAFVDNFYLPWVKENRRGSTEYAYKNVWNNHLKARCGHVQIGEFRTVDGEHLLTAIARDTKLTKNFYKQLKSLLSGIFTQARRLGFTDHPNPMRDVSIPKAQKQPRQTGAYSLEQIWKMLRVLPEPERTIISVAAFTGMRRGEIRGLRWENYSGKAVMVEQSIYRTMTDDPKSVASKAQVPVIRVLQKILDEYRYRVGNPASGLVFPSHHLNSKANSLSYAGISEDIAKVGVPWLGWHAFRRGLATNLHDLGVDDITIQAILRHSDVATTRRNYIKALPEQAVTAMDKLEAKLQEVEGTIQ